MNRSADASSSDATTTPAPATPPSPLVSSAAPAASALTPAPASGKWLRRLAWVMGGVAVLVAVSWVLVPPLLKSQLEKLASAQLGRALTVGKIDFKPWNLQLFVDDLTIAKADGSGPQLQIRRVFVEASLQSIRRLAPVVDAIAVDGLHLNLTHLGGGQYDVDDIIAKLNQPSDKPKADAAPPGFALYNLALNGASMDFNDQAVGKTHTLRALNLGVPFLSNLPGSRAVKTEPRLAFQVNGSAFDSRVSSTPFTESHKTDASIRISAFDLQPYLAYLPDNLPAELTSAVVDADVKVAFEQTSHTAVRLSGTVGAKNLVVKEKPVRPVVQAVKRDPVPNLFAFEALRLAFDDVRPLERVARLSLLELTAPKLAVARNRSGHVNLAFNREKAGKQFEKQAKNALDSGSVRGTSQNIRQLPPLNAVDDCARNGWG